MYYKNKSLSVHRTRTFFGYLLLGVSLTLLSVIPHANAAPAECPVGSAVTLDWDAVNWTDGATSGSFNVGGNTLNIAFTTSANFISSSPKDTDTFTNKTGSYGNGEEIFVQTNTGGAMNIDISTANDTQMFFSVYDMDDEEQTTITAENAFGQAVPLIVEAINPSQGRISITGSGTTSVFVDSVLQDSLSSENHNHFNVRTLGPANKVTFSGSANVDDWYFGFSDITLCEPVFDYSDAPAATYGRNVTHIAGTTHYLGSSVDAETSVEANLYAGDALGDDTDGNNDDDGVTLPTLTQTQGNLINVTVAGAGGFLQSWIDWDGNGTFDADEQIATDLTDNGVGVDTTANDGIITIPVTVPYAATTSHTFARFRWSTISGLDATSPAADGEVEDYTLTINPAPSVTYSNDYCVTPTGSTGLLDLGNMPTADTSGSGTYNYTNRILPGFGTVDISINKTGGLHKGNDALNDPKQQSWLDAGLSGITSGQAIYLEPNSSGTHTLTYNFNQPTGNVDLLLLDIDFEDTVSITALDGDGNAITNFSGWNFAGGDMSTLANPDPEAAAPIWTASTATLTSSDYANDHRSFAVLTPDRLVTQIMLTFTAPAASGRYIYSTLYSTSDDRDGEGSCPVDFGDAPASYGSAAHSIVNGFYLGAGNPDAEGFSLANSNASGDDLSGIDDDDGIIIPVLTPGNNATITADVNSPNGYLRGYLQGWIDWNGDGDFTDTGEQVAADEALISGSSGTLSISVTVPADAIVDQTFARFRWSSTAGLGINTLASDGEIEDYAITISNAGLGDQDYGDAPISGTAPRGSGTNDYGKASHQIVSGIYLGYGEPDAETANQSTTNADGDDLDGNRDEDGVTIPSLIQGASATIIAQVNGSGYLQGWVDWNGNGDFDDADEQIANDMQWNSSGSGIINIPVTVPATAIYGQTFARFRWSSTAGLGSAGVASDGEVEDYSIVITTESSREAACSALGTNTSDTPDGISDLDFPQGYWAASYFEGHNGISGAFNAQNGSGAVGSTIYRGEAFWGQGQNPAVIVTKGSGPNNSWLKTETPTSPTPPVGYVGDIWDSSGDAFYEINFRREIEWPAMLRFGYGANEILDDTIEVYINGKQAFAHWPGNTSATPSPGFPPGEGRGVSIPVDTGDQVWIRYINVGDVGIFSLDIDVIGVDCDLHNDLGNDYGDAPIDGEAPNGSDTNAYGEAIHTITSGIFMGDDLPDAETANQPTTNAVGDDQDDNDDEDGINIPPLILGNSTTLGAQVTGAGYLQGWIDWNGDGDFDDAGEHIANDLQLSGATSGTIAIPVTVPTTAIKGETFARFRWSTVTGLNSTGAAVDGEVEDYQITLNENTTTTCPAVFNPTALNFSNKTFNGTDSHIVPSVAIVNGKSVDMLLSLMDAKGEPPLESEEEGSQWDYPDGRDGPVMAMQVKPDDSLSGVYRVAFVNSGTVDPVEFDFEIALNGLTSDDGGGDLVVNNVSHYFPGQNPNAQAFMNENNTLTVSTRGGTAYSNENRETASIAIFNDVSTFDIEFTRINKNPLAYLEIAPSLKAVPVGSACAAMNHDYGDAPVSGPSPNGSDTNNYGEASHNIVAGIFMGIEPPDLDSSYQSGTAAEGDDLDGNDDEDGITFPLLRQSVDSIIKAQVTGSGYLQGWIDWNGDGDFTDAGEQVANNLQLAVGTSGTINIPIVVPVAAIASQTFARFRWSTTPGLGSTGTADDGEVEDYEITIEAIPLFGCKAAVDFWYANDESGSIDALEHQQSLDFIYQVTDSFYHSAFDGAQSGVIGWGLNTVDIIIPATDKLNDLSDYGLNSTTIVTDGDGQGIRERYNTRLANGSNSNLVLATQRLADLVSTGNGRRIGVPQVAVILTDASQGQLVSTSTGGESWVTAANALRAAVPEGIRIAVVLLDEANVAYDNDSTTKSVVDRVVGTTGLVIKTSNYAEVANQANGYISQVVDDLCSIATDAATSSISGRVFEDQNYGGGNGNTFGVTGTVGINGAIVELYDVNGNHVGATQSGARGYYILPRIPDGNYFVRVVNGTVNSGRTGSNGDEVPVMTYRSADESIVTNEIGGRYPDRSDAWINNDDSILNTSTFIFNSGSLAGLPAQSLQPITIFGSSIKNTNFGFNFNTVVNTNDAGQGSLQQFVLNNNILDSTGIKQYLPAAVNSDYQSGNAVAVFMIPATELSAGEAIIELTTELRIDQPNIVIDGRVQTENIGSGSVVLTGNDKAFNDGIFLTENAGGGVLRAIAVTDFDGSGIVVNGSGRNHSSGVRLNQLTISDNGGYGVLLENGAVNNQIIANQIWDNNWAGIASDADPNNTFSSNSLYRNNGIGIDLGLNGVTKNSNTDAWLNYPEVGAGSTISSNGTRVVAYDFDIDVRYSAHGYRLEFFSNTEADPSGHGEGESYLGYIDIQAYGKGPQNFKGTLNANQTVPATASIAVTLTEKTGAYNLGATSEFSGVRNRNLSVCTDLLSNPDDPIPSATIDENTTNITFLEALDVNGNPITYLISGGVDGDKFVINAPPPGATFDCLSIEFINDDGIIISKRLPTSSASILRNGPPPPGDYEAPVDNGQDNTYDLIITAIDTDGNSVTKPIAITVQNVNEKPRLSAPPSISYRELQQTVVIDLDAYDPDAGDAEGEGLRYRISSGDDASQFNLDPMTGELSFKTPPDYSTPGDENADNQYEVTVRVIDSQGYSSSQTLLIVVTDDPDNNGISLSTKALLQGAFEASSGLMTDHLRSKGLLPMLQPYSSESFNYAGTEQVNLDLALIEGSDAMVDWVLLELRSAADPQQVIAAKAALVQRDGDLMDAETGSTQLFFATVTTGDYYLSLRHRNHLGVMTASPQSLTSAAANQIDFSDPATVMQGEFNRLQLAANDGGEDLALLWSGDINHDNRLILRGVGNDMTQVISQVLMAPENTAFNSSYQAIGYHTTDLNLDGITLFTGPGNDSNILLGNILVHPANTTFAGNFIAHGGLTQ